MIRTQAASTPVVLGLLAVLGAYPAVAAPPAADHIEVLAKTLVEGVPCTTGARQGLEDHIKASDLSGSDVGVALAIIASANDACAPVRLAASAINADYAAQRAASAEAVLNPPQPTREMRILADVELDAQARVASRTFDSPPPPPHLTKGRSLAP